MGRPRSERARYPQKCKICGHSWRGFTWAGPKACPGINCGNPRWRLGPAYLTANRKLQGWKSTKQVRRALSEEEGLLGTPLYSGEGIVVEPLGIVGKAEEGPCAPAGAPQPSENGSEPGEAL